MLWRPGWSPASGTRGGCHPGRGSPVTPPANSSAQACHRSTRPATSRGHPPRRRARTSHLGGRCPAHARPRTRYLALRGPFPQERPEPAAGFGPRSRTNDEPAPWIGGFASDAPSIWGISTDALALPGTARHPGEMQFSQAPSRQGFAKMHFIPFRWHTPISPRPCLRRRCEIPALSGPADTV